jgi:hypothetical protein
MDIEVMGMVITQAYDGEDAWVLNRLTGAARDMPAETIFTDTGKLTA